MITQKVYIDLYYSHADHTCCLSLRISDAIESMAAYSLITFSMSASIFDDDLCRVLVVTYILICVKEEGMQRMKAWHHSHVIQISDPRS